MPNPVLAKPLPYLGLVSASMRRVFTVEPPEIQGSKLLFAYMLIGEVNGSSSGTRLETNQSGCVPTNWRELAYKGPECRDTRHS